MQLFCILTVLVNSTNVNSGPELSVAIAKSASESLGKSKGPEVLDPFHHVRRFANDLHSLITFPNPKTAEAARPVCFPVPKLHKFPGMTFNLPIGFGIPNGGIPGLPPLPAGLPPLPAGLPPLPAGLPPVPAGLPPLPAELPPVPAGLPPLPVGLPPVPVGLPPLPAALPPLSDGLPPLPDIFEDGSQILENVAAGIPRPFPEADPGADILGIGELMKDITGSESEETEDERQRAALIAMRAEAPQKTVPKTSAALQPNKAKANGANGAAAASPPVEPKKKSTEKAAAQKGAQLSGGAPPSGGAPHAQAIPQKISAQKAPVKEPLSALVSAVPETLTNVVSSVASALPVAPPPAGPAEPAAKDLVSAVASAVPSPLAAAESVLPVPPPAPA